MKILSLSFSLKSILVASLSVNAKHKTPLNDVLRTNLKHLLHGILFNFFGNLVHLFSICL